MHVGNVFTHGAIDCFAVTNVGQVDDQLRQMPAASSRFLKELADVLHDLMRLCYRIADPDANGSVEILWALAAQRLWIQTSKTEPGEFTQSEDKLEASTMPQSAGLDQTSEGNRHSRSPVIQRFVPGSPHHWSDLFNRAIQGRSGMPARARDPVRHLTGGRSASRSHKAICPAPCS
jgi:hypothetical protein